MKKIKILMIALLTFLAVQQTINAQETVFYTNNNGVHITESQYNFLLNFYNSQEIENMTYERFNNEMNRQLNLAQTSEKYIKTITYYDENGSSESYEIEVTEDEYNNPISPYFACTEHTSVDCWETAYKQVSLHIWSNTSNLKDTRLVLINRWKVMPSVRSFDVIGLRYNNGYTPYDAWGDQCTYTLSDGYQYVNYSYGGSNMKITNNGIGISQNLLNDTSITELENRLVIDGMEGETAPDIYGSYQHAVADVTLAESKSYTFGNGLGGVFIFSNSSIASKYDGMQGVSVQ